MHWVHRWTCTVSALGKLYGLFLLPGMFLPHRLAFSPFSSLCLLITIEMRSVLSYIKLAFPQSLSTNIPYSLFTLLYNFLLLFTALSSFNSLYDLLIYCAHVEVPIFPLLDQKVSKRGGACTTPRTVPALSHH